MGVIYNPNVKEKELYAAYSMTVYGKINRFEWIIFEDRYTENCLISIRITDADGNDLFSLNLGNNAILERVFDDTIDNFLYWIATDNPNKSDIEQQVFRSLCQTDSIFNHLMEVRKHNDRRKALEEKRIAEQKEKERAAVEKLTEFCKEHGFFFYIGDDVVIVKALTNNSRRMFAEAQKSGNNDRMKSFVDFIEAYPQNHDAKIVKRGDMKSVLEWMENGRG